RCMHGCAAFDGKLWVLGGRRGMMNTLEWDYDDVWNSDDGRAWREVVNPADWTKRYGSAVAAFDDRLWLFGGTRFSANHEVWWTRDGERWIWGPDAEWSPRFLSACVVFDDKLWILGGKEGGGVFTNDVWSFGRWH